MTFLTLTSRCDAWLREEAEEEEGEGGATAGAVSSGPPTYIYLLRLALLLPSPPDVPLSPACSILFPSFPSDIRGLPTPSAPFQPSLPLPPSPPPALPPPARRAQPLAHPSRLTYLNLPLCPSRCSSHPRSLLSQPPTPFPPSFSPPSLVSRPLPSRSRLPLPPSLFALLGLCIEMLPPTNRPQTLYSFTQS